MKYLSFLCAIKNRMPGVTCDDQVLLNEGYAGDLKMQWGERPGMQEDIGVSTRWGLPHVRLIESYHFGMPEVKDPMRVMKLNEDLVIRGEGKAYKWT